MIRNYLKIAIRTLLRSPGYSAITEVSFWVYPLTGLAALLSTLMIVSTQAIRAAGQNPVKPLRRE